MNKAFTVNSVEHMSPAGPYGLRLELVVTIDSAAFELLNVMLGANFLPNLIKQTNQYKCQMIH